MKTLEKTHDKFINNLNKYLDSLPEDEKMWAVTSICTSAIINISSNHVEELGIVEVIKDDLKDFFKFCNEEENKEGE